MAEDSPKTVAFENPFFARMKKGFFRRSGATDESVLVVDLGEGEVVLPLGGIRRELDLADDSPDKLMLDLVDEALSYVIILHQGDPLPGEVCGGEPSWKAEARHRDIAYHRLTMQLVTWMSGEEELITDPGRLLQIAEDPATRKKVNDAFGEAAVSLGFGPDGRDQVVALIEDLAEKLSHVEALREQFGHILGMREKILAHRDIYTNDQGIMEIVRPVSQLIITATGELGALFDQIDAQTGEIMAVLRNIDSQIEFITGLRNDLTRRLLAWQDILAAWRDVEPRRSRDNENLMRETWKFLAPRFMQVDEWVLFTQLQDEKAGERKSEMNW